MSNDSLHPCWRRVSAVAIAIAAFATAAQSQTPPPANFEVASVRVVKPYSQAELSSGMVSVGWSQFPTHHFYAHHVTLGLLLSLAYGFEQKYMDRLPSWADEDTYDIEANVPGDQSLTYDEMKPLLQHLLQQRFQLAAHAEKRQQPGFSLIVGKGTLKLTAGTTAAKSSPMIFRDRIVGRNLDLPFFSRLLARPVGQPVQDRTGLPGKYDVDLRFRPTNDPDSNLPDIFTAVREQLGLKLVRTKLSIEYLVVDQVNRVPAEN